MKIKYVFLILLAVLCLAFTGCDGNNAVGNTKAAGTTDTFIIEDTESDPDSSGSQTETTEITGDNVSAETSEDPRETDDIETENCGTDPCETEADGTDIGETDQFAGSADETTDSETVTSGCSHEFTETVTAPTCTKKGYTLFTCRLCGYSEKRNTVKAVGHCYGEWTVTKDPTCLESGKKYAVCSSCGKKKTATLPKVDCVYDEPTCSKPPLCIWCRDYVDDPLGHDWDDGVSKGDVSADGSYTVTYTCRVCSEKRDILYTKNIPDELTDNPVVRCLEYIGYDIDGQIGDGSYLNIYGSFELSEKYRSEVMYDRNAATGIEGLNTVKSSSSPTGYLPDLAAVRKRGLVCASFTAFYLFNYLPNIEGTDVSEVKSVFEKYIKTGYHYRAVLTWTKALQYLDDNGSKKVELIGTTPENVDRSKLSAGDIILFKNANYSNLHIALYLGTYNGKDYIAHCTYLRGVEINTLSDIKNPFGVDDYPLCETKAFYHLKLK